MARRHPLAINQRQPYPFVQVFDLDINGYTAAQRARLKTNLFLLPLAGEG